MNFMDILEKIKLFWEKYEYKIVLILGFVLVAILSFETGFLRGQKIDQNPMIVKIPAIETQGLSEGLKMTQEGENKAKSVNISSENKTDNEQNCAFVGSKNSNKYHLPTCRYAKNINPENIVCFSSENDAKSKGYLADKNCIK